jgi:hypothetical protein
LNYYGKLNPEQQTGYQVIKEYIPEEGYFSYRKEGIEHWVGGLRCATPPLPPPLPPGYYTFKIIDSLTYFTLKVTKL